MFSKTADCPVDIAFLLDGSGSIRDANKPGQKDNWQIILDFVNSYIDRAHVGPGSHQVNF